MKKRYAILALLLVVNVHAATYKSGHPRTTDNDDSCDIAQLPAATLLLPYFEVDITSRNGENTLITITNVSPREQIAHVTLWTDLSYPVIAFNVFLTGYDVQSISLYEVIVLGQVASPGGTGFQDDGSPQGAVSRENDLLRVETCRDLPVQIVPAYTNQLIRAFTLGELSGGSCARVGTRPQDSWQRNRVGKAIGYATIDVVRSCTSDTPADASYYAELMFDNVLTGDYQQVNGGQNFAQSNPMVHIRAIPEGERGGDTNLKRTFYSGSQAAPNKLQDKRQPLPSVFAARWIHGGPGSFETFFNMWRQGFNGTDRSCAAYRTNQKTILELAWFDEEENGTGALPDPGPITPITRDAVMPSVVSVEVDPDNYFFPNNDEEATSGWMYLNLDTTEAHDHPVPQAWVTVSLRAEGRYSGDHSATPLGNGCSPRAALSEVDVRGNAVIGPAGNPNP